MKVAQDVLDVLVGRTIKGVRIVETGESEYQWCMIDLDDGTVLAVCQDDMTSTPGVLLVMAADKSVPQLYVP